MNKLFAMLLIGCTLLFLTACPKPGSSPNPPDGIICGGLHGKACPDDQYCSYAADANCGFADATGVCKSKPEICTTDYRPVCGCNDKTYGNPCVAARNGVSVKYDGPCKQMCGGIANIQCPDGLTCVDDPDDTCNPGQGGADCSGICIKP